MSHTSAFLGDKTARKKPVKCRLIKTHLRSFTMLFNLSKSRSALYTLYVKVQKKQFINLNVSAI